MKQCRMDSSRSGVEGCSVGGMYDNDHQIIVPRVQQT